MEIGNCNITTICICSEWHFPFSDQVLNDKGYDGRASDVWSCGVILFVLMAGFLPFDESNLMALYRKVSTFHFLSLYGESYKKCTNKYSYTLQICRADFSCPSWFSSGAKKLIKRILDPNPDTVSSKNLTCLNLHKYFLYLPPVCHFVAQECGWMTTMCIWLIDWVVLKCMRSC